MKQQVDLPLIESAKYYSPRDRFANKGLSGNPLMMVLWPDSPDFYKPILCIGCQRRAIRRKSKPHHFALMRFPLVEDRLRRYINQQDFSRAQGNSQ